MSNYQESRTLPVEFGRASAACQQAAAALGMRVQSANNSTVELKEKFSLLSLSWPATVIVDLKDAAGASTEVCVTAKNFGFGPIQSRAMRDRAEKFFAALESAVASSPA